MAAFSSYLYVEKGAETTFVQKDERKPLMKLTPDALIAEHYIITWTHFALDETPRDFVDVYLKEVSNSTNPDSSFYGKRGEESLIAVLLDLFLAGL